MTEHNPDRSLLAGLLALQCQLIERQQLVDACELWSEQPQSTLMDLLIQQGTLRKEDRFHLDYLLQRTIDRHAGSVRDTLASLPEDLKTVAAGLVDQRMQPTLQGIDGELTEADWKGGTAPQVVEKITLKGLHSTGGIGQVWIAFDETLGREIALKELKPDKAGAPQNRRRFFREAQLTGQLEHPGIVPVYEYSTNAEGSRCYYTMRFVRGRTLTESIAEYHRQRRGPAGPAISTELLRLLNVFITICQTIAYAHSRNVIHRDLKGDNVILGKFGEVIVLDWGLAKRLDEAEIDLAVPEGEPVAEAPDQLTEPHSATLQGERLGTPAYMAPEQALGHIDEIDRRTDIYGLAAILYEILTGRPPLQGRSIVEILHHVIHDPPKPPTELVPGIPVELERICLQGLAKERNRRQQAALELAEQIQSWIAQRAERKRTEQERERFFSLSLDLLAILNAQGGLTQTNPAWEQLLGWSAADLQGMTVWELLPPEEHPSLRRNLERILAGESLTAIEYRTRCRDGSHRWVLWNASLIAGEGSIYLVGRDITERKQSEQTFQELLESAPDGMVVVNQSGQIVLVNAQLERMFGFAREELLGQPIELLVPEEHRAGHPAHVARFMAQPDFRPMASGLKLYGRRRDGVVFPAEISLSPVTTEQGLLVSCAVRDRSGRQQEA